MTEIEKQIQCEKCDGEVNIVNTSPTAYECVCKKCGHNFTWIQPEER